MSVITKVLAILISIKTHCLKIFMAEPAKVTVGLFGLFVAIAGLILAYAVAPVKISGDTADDFFRSYFSKVAEAGQRAEVYNDYFTTDYHHYESLSDYESFWRLAGRAAAWQAMPMNGPLEFEVTMTFHPAGGTPWTETIDYYLKCTQVLGAIPSRLVGCPVGDIRIDRLERVS
jgi:hypothetical protein